MSRYDLRETIRDDKKRRSMSLPNRGKVVSTIPELESVQVETFGNVGNQRTAIRHPYMGVNSWIRVMPEQGTSVVTQARGDYAHLDIWGYLSTRLADVIKDNRKNKSFLYRVLKEGEIEIQSKGRAYTHFSDVGDIETKGGLVTQSLLHSDLEHKSSSPTFSRKLHLHDTAKVGHEERFGVVKRPDTNNPNSFQKYIRLTTGGEFAQEYSRWMDTKDGKGLVTVQEGHVVDDDGEFVKHSTTNKNLRSLRQLFHKSSGDLSLQIDEELNILLTNVNTAKETTLTLGNQNALSITAKELKETYTATGDMNFGQIVRIKSPRVSLNSANVTCGTNPIFPLVMGQQLNAGVLTPSLNSLSNSLKLLATHIRTAETLYPTITGIPTATALDAFSDVVSGIISGSALTSALTTQIKVSG